MAVQYIPFYRKYRPKNFSELVGQDVVVQTFNNAIVSNKIVHAYLFCGPRGTGKTSTARILAKSLNCKQGPTFMPCDLCDNCTDISNGSSIDVIEIDAASHGGVEDARHIVERVQYAPVSSKYKIFIIDEVHMLSTAAFNVLLKTLEEPPENYVFILATTEPHKLLNTIISRCQRFDFRRINTPSLVEHLEKVADMESIKIDKQAISLIARKSSGGLRDALGLLDQVSVLSLTGKEVTRQDIIKFTGAIPEDILMKLIFAIVHKDSKETLTCLRDLIDHGNEPSNIVKDLTMFLRNILIVKAIGSINAETATLINASEEIFDDLQKASVLFDSTELSEIIFKTSALERQIKYSNQPYLWLEVGLISLCYRFEINALSEFHQRLELLENKINAGEYQEFKPVKPVATTSSKPKSSDHTLEKASSPHVPKDSVALSEHNERVPREMSQNTPSSPQSLGYQDDIDTLWNQLLDHIDHLPTKSILRTLGSPIEINGSSTIIGVINMIYLEQMSDPKRKIHVENALKIIFGKLPHLNFVVQAKPSETQAKKTIPSSPRKQAKQHEKNADLAHNIPDEVENLESNSVTVSQPKHLSLPDSANMVLDLFNGKILDPK